MSNTTKRGSGYGEDKYDFKERGILLMKLSELHNGFLKYIELRNPEYYEKLISGEANFPRRFKDSVYGARNKR